jgi:uncharacterized repeat protein (TIGR02543 family)
MPTPTQARRPMPTGMRRWLRTALTGSLLFGGLITVSLAATTILTEGTASATTTTLFSSTTSGSYSVAIPPGVTSVSIKAVGGTGGSAGSGSGFPGGAGGAGAVVTDAAAAVSTGNVLTVTVAQNAAPGAGNGGSGGYGLERSGAAGGGASAVYDGLNPLVVAGGGGGGGPWGNGGPAGQAGGSESDPCSEGGAGSQTSGGGAGSCSGLLSGSAAPGSLGNGGDGGSAELGGLAYFGGGGGGGGFYGGGGAPEGGGGGGSSYPPADVTGLDSTATPSIIITYSAINDSYSYASGGGTGTAPASGSGLDGSPITLATNTFTRPGYSFAGWNDGTTTYPAGYDYTLDSDGAAITFTAQWTANPILGFRITTTSLPNATPGDAYGPVTLQAAGLGTSTSPYVTSLKWKKVGHLPKGLKLSKTGMLSGTPSTKLTAGTSSVKVQVTETVTTRNGKKKVKTKTTVSATFPLTIT